MTGHAEVQEKAMQRVIVRKSVCNRRARDSIREKPIAKKPSMPHTTHSPILRFLHKMLGATASGNVTDAELLGRFVSDRDQAAFELLLWRHGPMVLSVCRDVLHDEHDAED